MGTDTRDDAAGRLARLQERQRELQESARALVAQLAKVRAERGNPFFYTDRPENAHQSAAEYTGYRSHDAGADVILELRRLASAIKAIQLELGQA